MSYLQPGDRQRLIEDTSIEQIISGKPVLYDQAQSVAIEEAKSRLSAKYLTSQEFADTVVYNPNTIYKATNRVYLDGPFYNPKQLYALKAIIVYQGKVYQNTTIVTVAEDFDQTKWLLLGNRYDMFYGAYPNPLFDFQGNYNLNDLVWWNDSVYTCKQPTIYPDHESSIQYEMRPRFPYGNIFPTDPRNGLASWGVGVAYTIPAGSILNPVYFTPGDNRNQQLVTYILDILIYNLYSRISPQIVPENRIMRYQVAISWLKQVAVGDDIIANIPKKQPPMGMRILAGSRPKLDNSY